MFSKFYLILKNSFISLLLLIFLYFLAWPSIERYLARGIFIEEGRPQQNELNPPAITFCAKGDTGHWKNNTSVMTYDMVSTQCKELDNVKDILDCVDEKTFSLNDTIKGGYHDILLKNSIFNPKFWMSNMGHKGMCHTFLYPFKLKADLARDLLMFVLDPSLDYGVFIHDPNYFTISSNPLAFPRILKQLNDLKEQSYELLYISLTEHHLLNRDDQPCEDSVPDYNFMKCIKTSQAIQIGCRPGWEGLSDPSIPVCTTMEQLSEHQQLDFKLFTIEQKTLFNITQCKIPCNFKEFAVVGEPFFGSTPKMGETDKYEYIRKLTDYF